MWFCWEAFSCPGSGGKQGLSLKGEGEPDLAHLALSSKQGGFREMSMTLQAATLCLHSLPGMCCGHSCLRENSSEVSYAVCEGRGQRAEADAILCWPGYYVCCCVLGCHLQGNVGMHLPTMLAQGWSGVHGRVRISSLSHLIVASNFLRKETKWPQRGTRHQVTP